MTETTVDVAPTAPFVKGKSEWVLVWERLRRKRLAMIALAIITVIYGAGLFAPLVAPYSYTEINVTEDSKAPARTICLGPTGSVATCSAVPFTLPVPP